MGGFTNVSPSGPDAFWPRFRVTQVTVVTYLIFLSFCQYFGTSVDIIFLIQLSLCACSGRAYDAEANCPAFSLCVAFALLNAASPRPIERAKEGP